MEETIILVSERGTVAIPDNGIFNDVDFSDYKETKQLDLSLEDQGMEQAGGSHYQLWVVRVPLDNDNANL